MIIDNANETKNTPTDIKKPNINIDIIPIITFSASINPSKLSCFIGCILALIYMGEL